MMYDTIHLANNNNWRGRRLNACRLIDELQMVINNLGVEDDPTILPPVRNPSVKEQPKIPITSDAHKRELINQTQVLLRTILLWNDESISDYHVRGY